MDAVEYWPYVLRSARPLNARSARLEHAGALIRVGGGVGCLHPWPELGDAPLERQLQMLVRGEKTPLIEQALCCAAEDGEARARGHWLLEDLKIPASHALVPPMATDEEIEQLLAMGFVALKWKLGGDGRPLLRWAEKFPEARWRLDSNEVLQLAEAVEIARHWPENLRERIDFWEDPCPYDPGVWQKLADACGIRLAVDRHADTAAMSGDKRWHWVVKPARDPVALRLQQAINCGAGLVVTSYMDHPIGQAWAALNAARVAAAGGKNGGHLVACGVATHLLFEDCPFSREIKLEDGRIVLPEGGGLGYDGELGELFWKSLSNKL